jgi:pimeloyl-ACP methyl ester carboxylesterase
VEGATGVSTFVFVHGAWHGAWCWERLTPLLGEHRVTTPTLSGLGERTDEASRSVTLDAHIDDLVAALDGLDDAVVVAHSYAGFVAYGAADRTGAIGRLVLLDSFIPCDGETMADHVGERGDQYRAAAAEDPDWLAPAPPAAVLGVAEEDRAWVDGAMTSQPVQTYLQPIALTGAAERLERQYISCVDPALPTIDESRRRMAAEGVPVTELACGHDAMIAAPEQLAAILLG